MRGRGRSASFGTRRIHELHVMMRRRRFSQHITYVLCRVPESRQDPDLGDTCAREREAGESVIFVVRELYGVGLRPSFSSGDCCTTRRMSAQHKFELESVGLVLGGPAGAAPSDVQ